MEKRHLREAILKLFTHYDEVNLHAIAKEANLQIDIPANRRAIQRALTKLVNEGRIKPQGEARARVYLLSDKKTDKSQSTEAETVFNNITLSNESSELLKYISRPLTVRKPVGYDKNFLREYKPNETFYLSAALREELHAIGKVEIVQRPAGTYARDILNKLFIDLSWNSSRLEGNTYSILETKRLIEFGENAEGKNATEAQMILNHKNAIEYIVESSDEKNISAHEIYSIHALLSDNLLGDPSASGRLRKISVGISGTTYLPLDNQHLLDEYFNIFIKKLNSINDPFEKSFFSLVHLSYLQAFEDVNKRTSRLVANIPMIKKNLKPLSFTDVSQKDYALSLLGVYEKNNVSLLRDLFCWAYKRSALRYSALQQTMGEPNLLKLKYRNEIQIIVRTIIVDKIKNSLVVATIKKLIESLNLPESEAKELFQVIEIEIMNLHDGNIARYKITPSEYKLWKDQ